MLFIKTGWHLDTWVSCLNWWLTFRIFDFIVILVHHFHDLFVRFPASLLLSWCLSQACLAFEFPLLQEFRDILEIFILFQGTVVVEYLLACPLANEDPLRVQDLLGAEEALRLLLVHFRVQDLLFPLEPDPLALRDFVVGEVVHVVFFGRRLIRSTHIWRLAGFRRHLPLMLGVGALPGLMRALLWVRVLRANRLGVLWEVCGYSQVSFTFGCTAVALGTRCFEEIELVVEGQLLIFLDIFQGKNANADLVQDRPFSCLAIWVATVVDKSGDVSGVGGVDDLVVFDSHQIGARRIFVTLKTLLTNVWINIKDFTNILHNKWVLGDIFSGSNTPTFKLRFNWINESILKSLEVTIRAIKHGRATESAALKTHVPIETSLSAVDRGLVLLLHLQRVTPFVSLILLRLRSLHLR